MNNILITGGSGFLGKHIISEGVEQQKVIYSLGRTFLPNAKMHIPWDSSVGVPELPNESFNQVIHVAGKAHMIPRTAEEKEAFFEVNFKGTIRLLESLERLSERPKQFVFISTIAVYGLFTGELIKESYPTDANTPYGQSKLQAEKVIQDWCEKHNVKFFILRLPLIVGHNPPGNLGKMKDAITKKRYVRIKGNKARKSMLLASDVAKLIFTNKNSQGVYNLTDGTNPSFHDVENALEIRTNQKIKISFPIFIARFLAKIGDVIIFFGFKKFPLNSLSLTKILSTLTFDDSKARQELNWSPTPVLPFIKKMI